MGTPARLGFGQGLGNGFTGGKFRVEELAGTVGVHEADFFKGATVEGADNVVAAVGDEGAVFGLAVFSCVVPVDVFAEAAAEEEDDYGDADDEADDVVDAVVTVFVAAAELYSGAETEGEEDE